MSVTIEKPVNGGLGNAETDQVLAWMPINGVIVNLISVQFQRLQIYLNLIQQEMHIFLLI